MFSLIAELANEANVFLLELMLLLLLLLLITLGREVMFQVHNEGCLKM